MKTGPNVYFHADDYGMTKESSDRVLHLIRDNAVNGVSILPNGCVEYAAAEVKDAHIPVFIHVNLVEGDACYQPQSLLTNPDSSFKHSFMGLLKESLLHPRKLKQQVYNETKAQLSRAAACFPNQTEFGIDSHQHVHMIPVLFRAILRAAKDSGLPIRSIRFPAEPISPFVMHPSLWLSYAPVNIIKNLVLNFLQFFNLSELKKSGLEFFVMCGILFSGQMDERTKIVYPNFEKIAARRGQNFCFVFHPAYIESGEPLLDPNKHSFNRFYLSENRKKEYLFLEQLSKERKELSRPQKFQNSPA